MTDASARLNAALAGRYRIERELGAGGMATVYLAHDVRHDRDVAVKVLNPELSAALGGDRFLSEIKTTARLQHPHILALLDSGSADGLLYYVMPYVSGETLRTRLERERQLPIEDALWIAREVADALGAAHASGIIHRDIKPENILLQGGHAMVADFGIALAVQHAGGQRMTQTGLSLGTPQYMSPEQAMGEQTIDIRSDIYALGAVTYEMLVGEPPFTGPTLQTIVAKVLTERPTAPRSIRDTVPPAVEAAILRALEKLPADRFESASAFADALADPSFRRSGAAPAARLSGRPRTWNPVTVGTTILAAASLIFAARMVRRDSAAAEPQVVLRFALSSEPGLRIFPDVTAPFGVSPDGRTIIFSAADTNGRGALWVRTVDDPKPRRLDGTDGGWHPAVSPDGQWVAFISSLQRLRKVKIAGGSPMDLAELPAGVARSLSWASNDVILCELIAPHRELYRIPATGGTPVIAIPLDSAAGEVAQGRQLSLPASALVLYSSTKRNGTSEFVLYSLRDRRRSRLGFGNGAPLAVVDGFLVYTERGALLAVPLDETAMRVTGEPAPLSQRAANYLTGTAVALSPSGTLVYEPPGASALSRLRLVDQLGKETPIRGEARRYSRPRFSPDGRRLAVAIQDGSEAGSLGSGSDLWIVDLASGDATQVTRSGNAEAPEWMPDGKRLMYVSRVGESHELWSTPLDGSAAPARLVEIEGDVETAVPMPDFRSVVAARTTSVDKRRELVRVSLDGRSPVDTLVTPLRPNDVRPRLPRVSPDGRLVAYSERNATSVHVRRLDGTGGIQISSTGGCCPVWAPDSRRVFFSLADSLVVVDLQTTPTLSVVGRVTRRGLLTSAESALAPGGNIDLSPDGKTFVTVAPVGGVASVFVAYNWAEELRRELRAGRTK